MKMPLANVQIKSTSSLSLLWFPSIVNDPPNLSFMNSPLITLVTTPMFSVLQNQEKFSLIMVSKVRISVLAYLSCTRIGVVLIFAQF